MILSKIGLNDIIIGSDTYYTLATGNTITINNKSLYLTPTQNERFINWEYTIVSGTTYEDLSSGIIYLQRGFYDITIYNDGEEIYTDKLFVDIDITPIYEIGDDDEIIYSIPN